MEKIKDILNPHHHKHSDNAEGHSSSSTERRASATVEQAIADETPEQRIADNAPHEKRHLIARQILNPGGDKYNPEQYGTPADGIPDSAAYAAGQARGEETIEQQSQDHAPHEKRHLIARQIFNPGGDKYNPEQYGTVADDSMPGSTGTATSTNTATGSTATSSQ